MANRSQSQLPTWRTKWPRNGDLKAWMRCMIEKCEAIEDDAEAAKEVQLPIERLAELGESKEALRVVNRFLKRLPKQSVLATVRMAELGARIALAAGELPKAEKYLATAEATEPYNTRSCDRGFSVNSVRSFRAAHGLLDPADAIDEEQRSEAAFSLARKRFDEAVQAHQPELATEAARAMEKVALSTKDEAHLTDTIERYAQLEDANAVQRLLRKLDPEERDAVLDRSSLARLGMTRQAIARAKRDAKAALDELAGMTDPNIHFPVMAMEGALEFLAEHGESKAAKALLNRALGGMASWPVYELGWLTSAVYTSLAKAAAAVGDAATADRLLSHATEDARLEKRRGPKKAAASATLSAQAGFGQLDAAIEKARKLRSKKERRWELAKLLARAQRWKQLREILEQVESAREAAALCWSIQNEFPRSKATITP